MEKKILKFDEFSINETSRYNTDAKIIEKILKLGVLSGIDLRKVSGTLYTIAKERNLLNSNNIPGWKDEYQKSLEKKVAKQKDIIERISNIGYDNVTQLRRENEALYRAAYRWNILDKIIWPNPLPKHLSDDELINMFKAKGYKTAEDVKPKDRNIIYALRKRELFTSDNIPWYQENNRYKWSNMTKDEIKNFIKDNGIIHKVDLSNEFPGLYQLLLTLGIDDYNDWIPAEKGFSQYWRKKRENEKGI